ncbi:MAG: DEAD/DEAH box helicase [Gammaproteobacteria bacterium]|nr:DEAD/DEAH box helicase [Gammaproteobacteria bacterium]
MSLSNDSMHALNEHWAIAAIGAEDIERALTLVRQNFVEQAVGKQIKFSFAGNLEDDDFLERVGLAFELAALEGLDELSRPAGDNQQLRDQAVAASFHAFDIRRVLHLPKGIESRLLFILELSAYAYCGDRWSDLRRWYQENEGTIQSPSVADAEWDERLLYSLFDCWIRLFRKQGWDDLDRIREIIAGLRSDQLVHEERCLNNESGTANRVIAFRLVALYHWAKASETLATYMLQGEPGDPFATLDKHFEAAITAATYSGDAHHEVILRWLHASARIMVTNSLWWATRGVNSGTTKFVRSLTRHNAMFELLPPQRAALLEQGLLDQAKTAIVVDIPTSGGKTLLAQFRILQALNQFRDEGGWVVYVAPTRALSAQITRRLREDFEPIGLCVEQLTAAIDLDSFEEELLSEEKHPFDILVATPEKLSLVIRNKKVSRPLALIVMDEAQNLESTGRGLRIELLLATVKQDCPQANFLLLMPDVERSESIARWLADDINAGKAISLGTIPWKPNERIIGLYRAVADNTERAGWRLEFETLTTTNKAMELHGIHQVGGVKPINVPKSRVLVGGKQSGLAIQTAAMGAAMSARGTSVVVTNSIRSVWTMAEEVAKSLPEMARVPGDIQLVQDFLRTEISPDFKLIALLEKGVGVHHAGLSDEVRALMEWLAESSSLRILCATSTIAQGINFPVSSVFLSTRFVPSGQRSVEISPRDFWNLVGRAGRINHDSVGVVGLAAGNDPRQLIEFLSHGTGALVSRLEVLLDELADQEDLAHLSQVIWKDQWEDFRCYISHLWAEKKNLDEVLADSERLLRQTYGYTSMRNNPRKRLMADALLEATKSYAHTLDSMQSGTAEFADATGFSPEGVKAAQQEMRKLKLRLTTDEWTPENLFGSGGRMADLYGVMLKVPQLKQDLEGLSRGRDCHNKLSDITNDWVNGKNLDVIARKYFSREKDDTGTLAITEACRAIYRTIVNSGTWGISALSRLSGIDFDKLPEADKRRINAVPAMVYHGVSSEDAVLMRMNSVPRSTAEELGTRYRNEKEESESRYSVGQAREFLKELTQEDWDGVKPHGASLSGAGYKQVWGILSGEAS